MSHTSDIYEYYSGNQLGVNQDVFTELNLLSYDQFQKWCQRNKLARLRTKGRGRTGLIAWSSIPDEFLAKIKKAFGDPYCKDDVETFINQLKNDEEAAVFFAKAGLSPQKEYQHYIEVQILNLYGELLQDIEIKAARNSGFKKTKAKADLSKIINELKTIKREDGKKRYPHALPANPRSLERRYKEYKEEGASRLIHKNKDNSSAAKIKGAISDFLIASYALPNKPSILDVWTRYEAERAAKKWPSLTEEGIYAFLMRPENEKIWFYGRHTKSEWRDKFGHKVSRDKSDWFPYVYLAIDGSKLDWLHQKKGAQRGYGADLKKNLIFDVYSEKIVGWDISDSEDHSSHFRAFKMAITETGCKPALITYDNQSGHKMQAVQELYNRLVTTNGGEHYPHRAYEHGSPAEQLIGRFQQQILNKKWWSDKQGMRTTKLDSRANMDFIDDHRGRLLTKENLIIEFAACVDDWNSKKHPHFEQSREEVATHAQTFDLDPVNTLEMMQLFWITTKDPSTYRADGLRITVAGTKHHFEVYDAEGRVDTSFLDKYTGCQFYTQYDPDAMQDYVRLYLRLPNGDSKYIADAEPIKAIKTINALMDDQDRARKHKMLKTRDRDMASIEETLQNIRHRTNINEETIITEQDHLLTLKRGGTAKKAERVLAENNSYSDKY